jgi:hypothetical protein
MAASPDVSVALCRGCCWLLRASRRGNGGKCKLLCILSPPPPAAALATASVQGGDGAGGQGCFACQEECESCSKLRCVQFIFAAVMCVIKNPKLGKRFLFQLVQDILRVSTTNKGDYPWNWRRAVAPGAQVGTVQLLVRRALPRSTFSQLLSLSSVPKRGVVHLAAIRIFVSCVFVGLLFCQ